MDTQSRLNRRQELEVSRKMTPEQRLLKAIELSELAKQAAREDLRKRLPHLSEVQIHRLYLKQQIETSQQKALIESGVFELCDRGTNSLWLE